MICPLDGSKDYDDLDCQECKYYQECFNVNQDDFKKDYGDNLSNLDRNKIYEIGKNKEIINAEQETRDSIKWIGNNYTYEMIEAIREAKTRLRYRLIFLKLGGTIPEKGE